MFRRLSAQPPQDGLLIAITVPPYGNDTIALTRYCASIGMPVAALTDRPDSLWPAAPRLPCSAMWS